MSWKVFLGGTNGNTWASYGIGGARVAPIEPLPMEAYVSGLSVTLWGQSSVTEPITNIIDVAGELLFTVASTSWLPNVQVFDRSIVTITGTANPVYFSFLQGNKYVIDRVNATTFYLKEYTSALDANYPLIELDNYGVKPYYLDESEAYNYFGGGYKRIKSGRLGFYFTPKGFRTRGDKGSIHDNTMYWNLMAVLQKRNIYILEFGSNFERILALNKTYPIATELYESSELSDDFAGNKGTLNFTLVERDLLIL